MAQQRRQNGRGGKPEPKSSRPDLTAHASGHGAGVGDRVTEAPESGEPKQVGHAPGRPNDTRTRGAGQSDRGSGRQDANT